MISGRKMIKNNKGKISGTGFFISGAKLAFAQ